MTAPNRFNPFHIDWNRCSGDQWDRMVAACKRPTLLQTWQYAMAAAAIDRKRADLGIIHFHDKPIGLVLVQIRRLIGPLAKCEIHRGPLWIHDAIPGEMQRLALAALRQRYASWRGKVLVFHPELEDTPEHRDQLRRAGFGRRTEGYRSIRLDLDPDEAALRRGLHQPWRNALNKAERSDVRAVTEPGDDAFDWLVDRYAEDKDERGYRGPSPAFLRVLRAQYAGTEGFQVCRAFDAEGPVAGVITVRHGNAATYLVGWNGDRGRALRAHHLLLWRAALDLKAAGVLWFDLGGINDEDAPGLTRFKAGMAGRPVTLVGGYT